MSRALIVNADDLGMSRSVNEGIAKAHRDGIVTSASLLANGEAFEDAMELVRACPSLGVGLHIGWVDGRPLSDPARVPTLVDRRGRFTNGWKEFLWRYLCGGLDADHLELEASAQIERALASGVRPDHLDSHLHLHLLPGIFERMVRLARRHRIGVLRAPRERMYDLWGDLARMGGLIRRSCLRFLLVGRVNGCLEGLRVLPNCFGVSDSCFLTQPRLLALLRALPEGPSELMCHPGTRLDTPGLRPLELAALTSPAVREAIHELGIRLITFAQSQKSAWHFLTEEGRTHGCG
jgi:hopanoid biosynthesis associated protein HpnK